MDFLERTVYGSQTELTISQLERMESTRQIQMIPAWDSYTLQEATLTLQQRMTECMQILHY